MKITWHFDPPCWQAESRKASWFCLAFQASKVEDGQGLSRPLSIVVAVILLHKAIVHRGRTQYAHEYSNMKAPK